MSTRNFKRFPRSVLSRYAELILRHVYQAGGRDRYISVLEIEDALGIEAELILELCRTRLYGELYVADRLPAELVEDTEFRTALVREWMWCVYSREHVRVRSPAVRLTEGELVVGLPGKRRKKKKRNVSRSDAPWTR